MSHLGDLAASLGHRLQAPQWRATSIPPVAPERFGKDHWSTFAYVETRIVDHKGTINHDHMRCDASRHPLMQQAKSSGVRNAFHAARYPSLLAAGEQLPEHDDYDCLDDLIAAGLLEVHMPQLSEDGDRYVDAHGKTICDADGFRVDPDFVTGMAELRLCAFATFSLTEKGRQVASDLRAHKAAGYVFASFQMA